MTVYLKYLPNVITITRMIALLPLMWLMWHKAYMSALILALLAGLSDGLDGFLAKKFSWQGWLGGVLDPLADKLMMLCCYSVLMLQGVLPLWLFLLVVGRDVVIVLGATYYHFRIGKIEQATPTLLSKTNTVLQIVLILALLLSLAEIVNWTAYHPMMFVVVGVFTFLSGVHYIWLGMKMSNSIHNKGDS